VFQVEGRRSSLSLGIRVFPLSPKEGKAFSCLLSGSNILLVLI